jgi:hypothetical protein
MITSARKCSMTSFLQCVILFTVLVALFAILYPVLLKSQSHDNLPVQSKMSELGRALGEYSQDNDNSLPPGSCAVEVASHTLVTGLGWAGQIYPYLTSSRVFDDGIGRTLPDPSQGSIISFAYNRNAARHAKLTDWKSPSRTVLLFQVIGAHATIGCSPEQAWGINTPLSPAGDGTIVMLMDGLSPRQVEPGTGPLGERASQFSDSEWPAEDVDGGSFFLMADGHVIWSKPDSISSGENALTPDAVQSGAITGRAAGTDDSSYSATFSTR